MVRRTWPAELIGGLLSEGPRKWSELFNGLLLKPSLERLFCRRINVSYPLCSECDTSQGGRVARTQSSEVVKSLCLCGVKRLLNFCHAKQARITMLGRCLPNVKRWLLPSHAKNDSPEKWRADCWRNIPIAQVCAFLSPIWRTKGASLC